MKFTRIIGKIDPKEILGAEKKLTQVFVEFGMRYDNQATTAGLGGDPLIFTLLVPMEHIATINIPTAGTDGKRFYWNPVWLNKQNLEGVRLVCYHEAAHAVYLHPQRRARRHPRLWNIAVDYIVNGMIFDDLKSRKKDTTKAIEIFTRGLGKYMDLEQCKAYFQNPFAPIPGSDGIIANPEPAIAPIPKADDDRALSEKEKEELERQDKKQKFFFADPNLPEDLKKPERIYDILFAIVPKCPECGALGVYQQPDNKNDKSDQKNVSGKQKSKSKKKKSDKSGSQCHDDHCDNHSCSDGHDHGQKGGGKGDRAEQDGRGEEAGEKEDQANSNGKGSCSTCGGGVNIFDWGDTVDEHMDADEDPEKMSQRIADAIRIAKQMAGTVPAGLEDELGLLTASKVRWQDYIRARLNKSRVGNSRNDWTRFRSRPMFAGLMIPKRTNHVANFGCLLDTSGSMSKEDMAYAISQLQSLDERSEGTLVYADSDIYWDKAVKIRKFDRETLGKLKPVGRGGTIWAPFFSDYEKKIGKCDFLIILTDGYLLDTDIAAMRDPGIPVYWVITSTCDFRAPFGKVLSLQ